MFFVGKLSIAVVLVIDLLFFFAIMWGYSRKYRQIGKRSFLQILSLYFLQLSVLLLFAPLRPEGCNIYISNLKAKEIKVIPIIQGKAEYSKQLKLRVHVGDKSELSIDLLRFEDLPRDFLFDFGRELDDFSIYRIELFTTFLSSRIPIIQITGDSTKKFFKPWSQEQTKDRVEATSNQNSKKISRHKVFLFQQSNEFSRHLVWQELLRRSIFWALFSTLLLGIAIILPPIAKLALRHAQRNERTLLSASAYYCFSVLILGISLSVVILVAEYTVRFVFRDVLSTASGINYFYNNSYKLFADELNSQKFRGEEFKWREDKKFRIVVIGDSISYGQGIHPYTLRYTDLAEQRLNTTFLDTTIEVINLGVCGQDLPQHLRLLNYVKHLHPDFILYQWFINDMDFIGSKADMVAPRLVKNGYWHEKLSNDYALYFLLQKAWQQFSIKKGTIKRYDQHIIDLLRENSTPASIAANNKFLQLMDEIKAIGKPYGVVLFPHAAFPIREYPFSFMHERIEQLCSQRNIPCLDLRQAYSPFDNQLQKLWANRFDPHPGVLAHDIAAKQIIDFFGTTWHELAQEKIKKNRQLN